MTRKLDDFEFQLLGGTDFMVHLVRNSRKLTGISQIVLDMLYDYLDGHAQGLYYIRTSGNNVVIYFEEVMDRANLDDFLRQFYGKEIN